LKPSDILTRAAFENVTNALQSYSTRSLYVRPASDNTASQNMFLNIFLVHLSIHRCTGGAAELTGFQCPCPLFWPERA
jgi:hypothetical protein